MKRYCSQCGTLTTDDTEKFCSNCGTSLPELIKQDNDSDVLKNRKIIIALLIIIIALFSMLILISGALDFRTAPSINVKTASPMINSEAFEVTLSDSEKFIEGKEIKITFKNNDKNYEYSTKTNDKGIATTYPSVELGDYEVLCEFEGDSEYAPVTVTKEVTVKQAEPDYQSFSYSRSFEDTDKNNDGYVYLNDMTIAHTPKNIQEKMFADSDDDSDGKLNHDEYYKFMYKLNYDRHSYGI